MGRLRSAKAGAFLSLCLGSACGGAGAPATPQPSTGPSAGPGTIQVSGATPVPMQTRLGQNYWCWSNFGNFVRGTEGLVAGLHLGVLRAGGHNNDTNTSDGFDPFDESQVDDFVAYCHRVGAEPILQVPLLNNASGGPATPADAADMVRYCNRTRGYGVRYWEIGNELWVADSLGAGIGRQLWAMCYWSLSEGWTLGFIEAGTAKPRPSYYAFQMVAEHVGPTLLEATAPAGFSVYASRSASGDATSLLVVNKNSTSNQETIVLSGVPGATASRSYDFPPYSLSALSIPDDGGAMSVWSYTKAQADVGSAPQRVQ